MIHSLSLLALAATGIPMDAAVDFSAARAVLERRCLPCHGGDERESGLSFADASTLAAGGSRGAVVLPGDLAQSRLLAVISYSDPDLAMPPSGVMPEDERATLEAWVLAGAEWPEGDAGRLADPAGHPIHAATTSLDEVWWAYEPLSTPSSPAAGDTSHPIDSFLRARLTAAGLETAPHAEPVALLRRATFDLTGLPPTAADRATFLRDVETAGLDAAWSRLLDRLFADPHYGEHQTRHWLDLVRYAETNGYERDDPKRNMWRYRDWVVRAFDRDMPYDQFVALQFAGDEYASELEDPTERDSALLATGFFRLGVWDDEPVDRAQAAADGKADVMDTFSQVVMGTTMGCCRCHDHKADPIAQTEYYALTAHIAGLRSYDGLPGADLLGPNEAGYRTVEEHDAAIAQLDASLQALSYSIGLDAPAAPIDPVTLVADARHGGTRWRYSYGDPTEGWATPGFDDSNWAEGQGGFGRNGTPGTVIRTDWKTPRAQIRTTFRLGSIPEALLLTLHHDDDAEVYLNGVRVLKRASFRVDYGTFQLDANARAALVVGRNVLALDCVQTGGGQSIDAGLAVALDAAASGGAIAALELMVARREEGTDVGQARDLLVRRRRLVEEPVARPFPAQVVQETGPSPPAQFVNLRGSVHALGVEVAPGVPRAWLKGSRTGAPFDPPRVGTGGATTSGRRRALVEWIFTGGAHLAARVEANRTWQFLFGRGLCRSVGDFGRLGERPTHPQLLDHLASELIAREWSRKSLQRYLMESDAYRMATVGPDAALAADPRNDLYWRFDPRRLTAEEFRDALLAASGELELARFGPSVFPPLPAEVLATSSRPSSAWGRSTPQDAARRSLYIHVKRSLREPLLALLDQPDPDMPCPERFPTNVPTQALLTLNGEFAQGRAAVFAASLVAQHETQRERLAAAIARALGREAGGAELERAEAFLAQLTDEHGVDGTRALELFALGLFNRNEFTWLD